jgi:hypothetical protein
MRQLHTTNLITSLAGGSEVENAVEVIPTMKMRSIVGFHLTGGLENENVVEVHITTTMTRLTFELEGAVLQ